MDINELLKQAQKMQEDLEKMSKELEVAEFEGSASNGLVKVTINGDNKVLEVKIDESVIDPNEKEMLEDLIVIAFNNAREMAENARNRKLSAAAGGLNIPRL